MSQSRIESAVEATIGTLVGFTFGVITQLIVLPWFGIGITFVENMLLCGIFTAVSLLRNYAVRRWCDNYLRRFNHFISIKVRKICSYTVFRGVNNDRGI